MEHLAAYTPNIDPGHWSKIGPFVTGSVTDAAPHTAYSERELFTAVTPLVLWAWKRADLPLRREAVFSQHNIDRYVDEGMSSYTDAGRGTIRSRLLRTAEALTGMTVDKAALKGLGPSEPTAPYSASDLAAMRAWTKLQPTGGRQISAAVLLALGIGAGLAGREILAVRVRDIEVSDHGVVVTVNGERPRAVGVLRSWETALIERARSGAADKYAFREARTSENHNAISDFVARSEAPIKIQSRRMRTTWLVHHLNAGTPITIFLEAAGVQSLEALDRFLIFADTPSRAETLRSLRG